jgi:dihydrofolate reductase
MIRAILACDSQGGIGRLNDLPWPHNKKDLAHFKKLTTGATVVMGRTTWESTMPTPLPNRRNIVVTRNQQYDAPGAEIMTGDIRSGLTKLAESNTVFVIGGADLLNGLFDDISVFHLTRIAGNYDCDTFLPLRKLRSQFIKLDSVQIDTSTTIETHIARRIYDFPIPAKI